MSQSNLVKTKEEMINQIKDTALNILYDAENIIGTSDNVLCYHIEFDVKKEQDEIPTYSISRLYMS